MMRFAEQIINYFTEEKEQYGNINNGPTRDLRDRDYERLIQSLYSINHMDRRSAAKPRPRQVVPIS